AAGKGHEAVVELLIKDVRVNSNLPDYAGWTPLLGGLKRHHGIVVRQLLAG
ncbi:uncharacterized protein BCR38DRAFT_331670, partial [Pseudomassariella vexata]